MKLTQDQIIQVQQAVRQYIEKARTIYKKEFAIPVVRFDLSGRTGGQAIWGQHVIRVNPVLCAENFNEYIKQTIGHEVAHLITYAVYGVRSKPHGHEWQSVMRRFGLPADRCHQYDTTNSRARQTTKIKYSCNCKVHEVGPTLHRRMQLGARYTCKTCGCVLKFGNQIGGSVHKSTVTPRVINRSVFFK